jgi:hypothetical protein
MSEVYNTNIKTCSFPYHPGYHREMQSKLYLKSDVPLFTPAPTPMHILSVISLYILSEVRDSLKKA